MSKWQTLVDYLRDHGPTTSGALGHVYGIGENVRGIVIEANKGLHREGSPYRVNSYESEGGPWATYALERTAHIEDRLTEEAEAHEEGMRQAVAQRQAERHLRREKAGVLAGGALRAPETGKGGRLF